MDSLLIHQFKPTGSTVTVSVPASKSLMNRALILAALSKGTVRLICGSYGEDTQAMLSCLHSLGIRTEINTGSITVHGCGGRIPNPTAEINVMSAGTAARFLTVALAFCGGNYLLRSSEQMQKRPMEILPLLEQSGARIEYLGEHGRFPFRLISEGAPDKLSVNTDESTQYASGILLAATALDRPFSLTLSGSRTRGSYIQMTLDLLADFGVSCHRNEDTITVLPAPVPPAEYEIEPDLSGACYFYALSLLFSQKVLVRRIRQTTKQGDYRFLKLLESKGVKLTQTEEGLLADGSGVTEYSGFTADMKDFSDQTMTVAALAPFASTPTRISGVEHIRKQECDRIHAICTNLNTLGVPAEWNGESIVIAPAPIKSGNILTFNDHRIAMAFSLIGLKAAGVTIENPMCCKKTFANYFEILQTLTQS